VARLRPGNTVLLLGTGGVSSLALLLAHASGIRTIVTSSSDEKLRRAQQLGANLIVNYEKTPDWDKEVLAATAGRGVDAVVEVGGRGTLEKSLRCVRMGGTVAVIGGVAGGFKGASLDASALIHGCRKLQGVFVGSRTDFEDLLELVALAKLRPPIDRVFGFDQAKEAYRYLEGHKHVGKVVIQVHTNVE
jgi:NADPH:quinone reductase-like Zn-dependent oxidoreductase